MIAPMQPQPPMPPMMPDPFAPMAPPMASMGIPPLNLDQGPSTAIATSSGEQTGTNTGHASSGDFVFKGTQSKDALGGVGAYIPYILIGGAAWLIIRRFM